MKVQARWETNRIDDDDAEIYCGNCDYNLDDGYDNWVYCPNCGKKIVWHNEPNLWVKIKLTISYKINEYFKR